MTVDCCGHEEALRMANERADRWRERANEARMRLAAMRARLENAADELDDWDGAPSSALGGLTPGGVVRYAIEEPTS